MKKKSNELEILKAYSRYQIARYQSIISKMITDWYGDAFWAKAPDTLLNYMEQTLVRGNQAATLLNKYFKFKRGTTNAL
jgi:hypothetical protein